MLISHRKKFIYTKTLKTAGTSVESYFEKYCMPEGEWTFVGPRDEFIGETGIITARKAADKSAMWRSHMAAADIKQLVGDEIWNSYFKFCVIRNPFDKLISGFYFYEIQRRKNTRNKPLQNLINRFRHKKAIDQVQGSTPVERFRSWIKQGGKIIDRDKYLIDDVVCVDYFIRYEELESGVRQVCNILNIPFEPKNLPRLKSSTRERSIPVADYYDPETIQIVEDMYRFELEKFQYAIPLQAD